MGNGQTPGPQQGTNGTQSSTILGRKEQVSFLLDELHGHHQRSPIVRRLGRWLYVGLCDGTERKCHADNLLATGLHRPILLKRLFISSTAQFHRMNHGFGYTVGEVSISKWKVVRYVMREAYEKGSYSGTCGLF